MSQSFKEFGEYLANVEERVTNLSTIKAQVEQAVQDSMDKQVFNIASDSLTTDSRLVKLSDNNDLLTNNKDLQKKMRARLETQDNARNNVNINGNTVAISKSAVVMTESNITKIIEAVSGAILKFK